MDIATLQHGPNNVLHDLAFALIQAGKTKQAEKIFQTPWLRARNERINLHSLLLAGKELVRERDSTTNACLHLSRLQ